MAAGVFTPYSTAVPLFGAKPSWITNDLDVQRIQAYQTYEEIYWTVADTFKVTFRGSNDLAIYVPTARTIVDTVDRYTAADFDVVCADPTGVMTGADVIAAQASLEALFRRERFFSQFNGSKLYGVMRGDWVWHVTANPAKAPGTRISITSLDPGVYFPITDDQNVDRVIGCHLVEQITTPDGPRIHRLTYRKVDNPNGLPTITVEEGLFEVNKWEGPTDRPSRVIRPPTALPPDITALPVYHIKNTDEPGNPFGSSEIRGLERIMSAVNQTVSDEDLALALEGIGLYMTDAPEPTDDSGAPVGWRLGPGRVVQIPDGSKFGRVPGVGSVAAYGDHYDRLVRSLKEAAATPDIAIGRVEAQSVAASSGVALALQLQPLLTKAGKKNTIILDVHNQMMFDLLGGWMPAFEGLSFDNVIASCVIGDPVPVDRAAKVAELNDMLVGKVIDTQYYRDEMVKLGYEFPPDMQARVDAEASKTAQTTAASFGGV